MNGANGNLVIKNSDKILDDMIISKVTMTMKVLHDLYSVPSSTTKRSLWNLYLAGIVVSASVLST